MEEKRFERVSFLLFRPGLGQSRSGMLRCGATAWECPITGRPYRAVPGTSAGYCQRRLKKLQTWRVKMLHPAEVTSLCPSSVPAWPWPR